jgi:flagellar M-ring protein FliF
LTSNQLEFKETVAKTIENRILTMLGGVLGREKITAKVSADVDFKQTEQTEEIYDPDSQVARSEQRNEESSSGATPVGGVAGATANQPAGQTAQVGQGAPSQSQKLNETINYEINKIIKRTINPTGEIRKLSVAVMIDGTYDNDKKYVPRTAQEMQQYKKIVERAVGYDEDRGDEIEVINVAFDISKFKEEQVALEKAEQTEMFITIARYGVTAIFIILLFVMLIKPLIGWLSATSGGGVMVPAGGARIVGGRMVPGVARGPGEMGEMGEEEEEPEEIKKIKKKEDYRAAVRDYAAGDPAHTAELVRKWLKERR